MMRPVYPPLRWLDRWAPFLPVAVAVAFAVLGHVTGGEAVGIVLATVVPMIRALGSSGELVRYVR